MTPISPAVQRELRDLTARRRRLGLTVHALAHVARLRTGRVCRPDGVALLRLHWALIRLESGWSLQQVRQTIEWRLRDQRRATASAAVAGGASTPAGGGGGRRVKTDRDSPDQQGSAQARRHQAQEATGGDPTPGKPALARGVIHV